MEEMKPLHKAFIVPGTLKKKQPPLHVFQAPRCQVPAFLRMVFAEEMRR